MAVNPSNAAAGTKFYIIGHNISHSLSPTIHNVGFAHYGLPYHYSIFQTTSIDETVKKLIRSEEFGGASVTFPHKLAIQDLLDTFSESAIKIGAVNTIVVESDGKRSLRGENTDWIGIKSVIKRSDISTHQNTRSIVIGAGGAARAAVFALQNIGVQHITIVNRTVANAKAIAQTFPDVLITVCAQLEDAPTADIIVGCIPADDIVEADIPDHIFAKGCGIVVEMSYRPAISALMKVAQRHIGWSVVDGVDVLKEQAYGQFQMWTGQDAPVELIEGALIYRLKPR